MAEALPDITTRLLEARIALHKLLTGQKMVSISYGERQVTYRSTGSDIDRLERYIVTLESQLGDRPIRRPYGVCW